MARCLRGTRVSKTRVPCKCHVLKLSLWDSVYLKWNRVSKTRVLNTYYLCGWGHLFFKLESLRLGLLKVNPSLRDSSFKCLVVCSCQAVFVALCSVLVYIYELSTLLVWSLLLVLCASLYILAEYVACLVMSTVLYTINWVSCWRTCQMLCLFWDIFRKYIRLAQAPKTSLRLCWTNFVCLGTYSMNIRLTIKNSHTTLRCREYFD